MSEDIPTRAHVYSIVLSTFFIAIGVLPLTWWLYVLTYAWRVSLYLGHWPYYNNPDPKTLPEHFQSSTEVLEVVVPWGVYFLIVALLVYGITRLKRPAYRLLFSSWMILLWWGGCMLLMKADPFGLMEWFFD